MKHNAQQIEVNWGEAESFRLAIEHTIDGERVAREKEQRGRDRKESEQQQITLL